MKLDIFIEGETIDLRIPTLEFAEKSDWYKWFNNPNVTQFLEHGIFPNTVEKQVDFFHQAMKDRLLLIITDKNGVPIGSTSLLNINQTTKTLESGTVIGNFIGTNPLEALEAVSRMTEHAFLKLGMQRIVAGQHIGLIPWSHRMSLLGYRIEGIEREAFVKGMEIADVIKIACNYKDYQKIIANRGGCLWDTQEKMLQRIKQLPKISIHKKLQEFFKENEVYYENIFSLGGGGQWRGVA